ncbi:aldose 1-epimerase family protein [Arenibaculum pallidiluteum]|uniref:aldose 1-epimerase family protein n=1 Tax=Arenibaculum pallidiluteum TaxID=2812559 RepID=UPI001A9719EC|nr:aldose 1-epimerase family protein [Arenibaculum pallidiluteum]
MQSSPAPSANGTGSPPECADGAVELRAGRAGATIAARGAEVISWSIAGRQLLWSGDSAWWPQVSPILFPIVGRVREGRALVDGVAYPLGIHGFASFQRFEITEVLEGAVRLELRATPGTLALYPFDFGLSIAYELTESGLSVAIEVANRGAGDMPYAVGFHPGFRWPLAAEPRSAHTVRFEAEERAEVPILTPQGLFSDRRRPVPILGRDLPLSEDLFAQGALCFLDAASRSMVFGAGPGGPSIRMAAENLPHLALWSRPGAGFLCMEAWSGHGDPDGFEGELRDKPSMRILRPTERATHRVTLEYRGGMGAGHAAADAART